MMHALTTFAVSCQQATGTDCATGLPQAAGSNANLQHLVQLTLGILAAVAVLFIVIAGLKFITSQGDPQGMSQARSTIIYALVGLIVAVSAEIMVSFVIGKF